MWAGLGSDDIKAARKEHIQNVYPRTIKKRLHFSTWRALLLHKTFIACIMNLLGQNLTFAWVSSDNFNILTRGFVVYIMCSSIHTHENGHTAYIFDFIIIQKLVGIF